MTHASSAKQSAKVPNPGPTAEIAERVCDVTYENLDDQAIAAVKLLIADGVAVAVAGDAIRVGLQAAQREAA